MNSFFPDLNVWLALSDRAHIHHLVVRRWLAQIPDGSRIVFARYTQVGLLRLLTDASVMGDVTLSLGQAWTVYDRWLADPRVEFHQESHDMDAAFREATAPFLSARASKWVGDCYLLAFARDHRATLVTFDQALSGQAARAGCAAITPG
jgi:toxin-antitoxin system PIN domain toxin